VCSLVKNDLRERERIDLSLFEGGIYHILFKGFRMIVE